MSNTIIKTDFNFPGQKSVYHGKVRSVYTLANNQLLMVATDRLSAFDVVMPKGIPFKGQILNQIATKMMQDTQDLVPNWLTATPDPNVTVGHRCDPIRLEMVIRGYLTGHAHREYASGKRSLCGATMAEGLREHDRFSTPIITPATKAEEGHDEDISPADILSRGLVSHDIYAELERITRALFARGTEIAASKGLILVDTKYEFGIRDGKIMLIDEIHTPDSSRFFYADGYTERQAAGLPQKQLSKEFVREWLISHDFMGLDGQTLPTLTEDFIKLVSKRYIELFKKVTGTEFISNSSDSPLDRIEKNVEEWLAHRA